MLKADTEIKLLKIDVMDKNLTGLEKILILEWRSLKFKEITLKSFLDGVHRTLSGLVEHMREKSPLTYSFTRLVGAKIPNIIAIKSNGGLC